VVSPALPPPSLVPTAVAFWDPRHGVLGTTGSVELTSNGGRTFRIVLRTRRPVVALQTAGPRGAIARLDGGGSLRTLDRGRTWKRFRERFDADFATPRIALGVRTALVRDRTTLNLVATVDGGRTWRERASPCAQAVASSAVIDLVTPSAGWIVCLGEPGAGNQAKAVFRTTDSGRSWRPGAAVIDYPRRGIHGGLDGYGYPEGVAFARDGFGILWESRGTLYVTGDGGTRWRAEPDIARPEIDFGRGAASFTGGRGLVLLGRGGRRPARLLATADGGRSWFVVHRWR
jgi:photosystem II stability/assembly factor-like uncharacterized protein